MKTCGICGNPIRTGIKYCYKCRHIARAERLDGVRRRKSDLLLWLISIGGIIFFISTLFYKDSFSKNLGYMSLMICSMLLVVLILKQIYLEYKRKKERHFYESQTTP